MLYQKYSTARMDASMSVKTYGHTRTNVSSYKKDNLCFERWQAARCFFTGCDRVRCISAHAGGMKGGWREERSESAGSNKQPSPILKGQKSWKGFIGTIKKTWNRCYVSLIKEIITSHQ